MLSLQTKAKLYPVEIFGLFCLAPAAQNRHSQAARGFLPGWEVIIINKNKTFSNIKSKASLSSEIPMVVGAD